MKVRLAGPLALGCAGLLSIIVLAWLADATSRRVDEVRRAHAGVAKEIFSRGEVKASADGFSMRRGASRDRFEAAFPRHAAGDVVLTTRNGARIVITERGAVDAKAELVDGAVVYANRTGARFWSSAKEGFEEWLLTTQRAGLPVAEWTVRGGKLEARDGDVVVLGSDGAAQVRVSAPRAFDAQGRAIAVSLRVAQDVLALHVEAPVGERVLVDPIWSATSSLGHARRGAEATLIGSGDVLFVGGETSAGVPVAEAERYSVLENTFSDVAPPALARTLHRVVTLRNGLVLVIGGQVAGGARTASCELYDPVTNTWSPTGPLLTARDSHTATVLPSGDVLVAGGVGTGGTVLASSERYSGGTWSSTAPLATARARHAATLRGDGRVLMTGGDDASANQLASTELYFNGAYSAGPTLLGARAEHSATLVPGGSIVVAGGRFAGNAIASAERIALGAGAATALPSLLAARYQHHAFVLPSAGLAIIGGRNNGASLASSELLTEGSPWTLGTPLIGARARGAGAVLFTGKVLLAGGESAGTSLSTAELFDEQLLPTPGYWTPVETPVRRYGQGAVTLPSGQVLACGGLTGYDAHQSCALYDPSTNTWRTTSSMQKARYHFPMTVLLDGRVFVTGGSTDGHSSEIFDPNTETWTATGSSINDRVETQATLLGDGRVLVVNTPRNNPLISTAEIYDSTSGSFSSVGSPLGNYYRKGALATISTGAMLIGGYSLLVAGVATVQRFDALSGNWSLAASLPDPQPDLNGRAVPISGNRVFVMGWYSNWYYIYDVQQDQWTTFTKPALRQEFRVVAMPNGDVGLFGGVEQDGSHAAAWFFHPGDSSWTLSTARPDNAHYNHQTSTGGGTFSDGPPQVVALANGDALLVGGSIDPWVTNGHTPARVDRYRRATDDYQDAGIIPSVEFDRRDAKSMQSADGRVFLYSGNDVLMWNSMDVYDTNTGTWHDGPKTPFEYQVHPLSTPLFDGKEVVLNTGNTLPCVFDAAYERFSCYGPPLPGNGYVSTMALLNNGKVAAFRQNWINDPYSFDPGTGQWTTATVSPFPPFGTASSAVTLPDGRVLAGSETGTFIGNIATRSWSAINFGSLGGQRINPTLLPLPGTSGTVLDAEGAGIGRYRAADDSWSWSTASPSSTSLPAARLPSGRLMLTGASPSSLLYDWQTDVIGTISATPFSPVLTEPMPNQKMLIATTNIPRAMYAFDELPPSADRLRPALQTLSTTNTSQGSSMTITGHGFLTLLGAAPAVVLRRTPPGWTNLAQVTQFSDTSITIRIDAAQQPGPYHIWVSSNGVPSAYKRIYISATVGAPCTSDAQCPSGYCSDGVCCNFPCNGGACDACSIAAGAPVDGICSILPSTFLCRPSASVCDLPESCDGATAACPDDFVADAGGLCRAAVGICDVAEYCDGASGLCPTDAAGNAGSVCRTSGGDCDLEEICDGISPQCPSDAIAQGGTVCRAAISVCDAAEVCDGLSTNCPMDLVQTTMQVCRPAASLCDVDESCNGLDPTCPGDLFASAGAECRAAVSVCDLAEQCTGASPVCPPNVFAPSTIECRASSDLCDAAERCTGTSALCPIDLPATSTTTCRSSTGGCDPEEKCNGSAKTCPSDRLAASGVLCRSAQGSCDLDERCTGANAACPSDAFKSASTLCRPALGLCDRDELCTGASAACPDNALVAAGTPCRASVDQCDAAEVCDGAQVYCPADSAKPRGTSCRESTAMCDVAEVCDGTNLSCPADSGTSVGSTIRQDANLVAAIGVPYRYNHESRVLVDGPTTEVKYKRCDDRTLPSSFRVDEQTGLVTWTPETTGTVSLCISIDGGCGSDRYEFSVAVASAAPAPPVARMSLQPAAPVVAMSVAFDGSASTADSSTQIIAYDWEFGDDVSALGAAAAHAYAIGGAYTSRLTVTDAFGSIGQASDIVTVVDPYCDVLPRVRITTEPLVEFGTKKITHGCDCEGVRFFSWDLGDGTTSNEATPEHEYGPGRYRVRLIGSESPGCVGQDTVYLEVRTTDGLRPPLCYATASVTSGKIPLDVTFKGLWGDPNPDGRVTEAKWTLDDPATTTSSKPNVDVTFETPGVYHAKLEVTASGGLKCHTEIEINALSDSGASAPRFLTTPNTSAICGQPYHYDEKNKDLPTVRGRSEDARFEKGQASTSGVEGVVEGMEVNPITGRVTWTPPAGVAGKKRIVLAYETEGGRATQEFEVDVACEGTSGCGCDVGAAPTTERMPLIVISLLTLMLVSRRRRSL